MPEELKDRVDFLSPIQKKYQDEWDLFDDLCEGTPAMRKASTKWLLQNEGETNAKYEARLSRTVLYPGMSRAVRRAAGKPFVAPVNLTVPEGETVPDLAMEISKDVDRDGTSLTDYCRKVLMAGVKYGWCLPTCYWPSTEQQGSKAEQTANRIRPVFGLITPPDVLGWRTQRGADGSPVLTMLRVREIMQVPDGKFGDKEVEFIRVLEPGRWSLYMKNEDKEFEPVPAANGGEGINTLGRIPVNPFYIERVGYLQGVSPFRALAYHNLAHWDSDSDQRNGTHWGRFPIVIETDVSEREKKKQKQISADKRWQYKSTKEKPVYFLETTGKALEIGAADLERSERIMEAEGLQPFVKRTGTQTATEKSINEAGSAADILAWIEALETNTRKQFETAGQWYKSPVEMPQGFAVKIFSDFGLITEKAIEELKILTDWQKERIITPETLLKEGIRRNTLSESVDPAKEVEVAGQTNPIGDEE